MAEIDAETLAKEAAIEGKPWKPEQPTACCDNTPRWKRRYRATRSAIKFWLYLNIWCRHFYRPVMKFAHRFNWHHMPPLRLPVENGERNHWCQWCGLRGKTYEGPKTIL